MTSIALLLAASATSVPQGSSASLANKVVWKMVREGSADGGNVVCAPTGELAGIASLAGAGITVPSGPAEMTGGDSGSAARLVAALYATDKSFSGTATLASSETSVWVTGATTKDGALANFDNLTPFYVNRSDRITGVERWLGQRVPSRVQTASPEVSRVVVTAATYGTQFLSCGQNRFNGSNIAYVMTRSAGYSQDDTIQIASTPIPENKKFSLVIASPSGSASMGNLIDNLEKNWREAVSGLPRYEMTLQFPRVNQTVDRSIDNYLALKAEDGISVRERLTVSLGSVPLAAKPADRKSASGKAFWAEQNYIHMPPMGFGGGPNGAQASRGEKPKVWVVDRPFFFAIADNSSGAIVYAGVYYSPSAG